MFQQFIQVVLKGIGQLAFVDTARGGALVLAGLTCFSPIAAIAMLTTTTLATAIHRVLNLYPEHDWLMGLSGYNAAVLGVLWSGFLTRNSYHLLWYFPVSLALCFAFEYLSRQIAGKVLLPILTLPAVLTAWLTAAIFAHYGVSFWSLGSISLLNDGLTILGILAILTAMSLENVAATVQAAALALLAATLSNWYFGLELMALSGLWGFTVVSASFGIQAIFFKGTTSAASAGLVAATIGSLVWLIWVKSSLATILPPLLLPFIIGSWVTLLLARKVDLFHIQSNVFLPIRDAWQQLVRRVFF